MIKFLKPIAFAILLLSCTLSGCVTQQEVKAIVAETNAAAISPYLDRPTGTGRQPATEWQEAVKRIDRLIEAHPDQATLVNHLRVRQAMLLTVNGQNNLALERWNLVIAEALDSERDKRLHALHEALVWAYKNLKLTAGVDIADASSRLDSFKTKTKDVEEYDLKIFLHTIRAEIALKLANSYDEDTDEAIVEDLLAQELEVYIDAFKQADKDWVKDNPTTDLSSAMTIQDIRRRVWLREIIKLYRAEGDGLSPKWSPPWVDTSY